MYGIDFYTDNNIGDDITVLHLWARLHAFIHRWMFGSARPVVPDADETSDLFIVAIDVVVSSSIDWQFRRSPSFLHLRIQNSQCVQRGIPVTVAVDCSLLTCGYMWIYLRLAINSLDVMFSCRPPDDIVCKDCRVNTAVSFGHSTGWGVEVCLDTKMMAVLVTDGQLWTHE